MKIIIKNIQSNWGDWTGFVGVQPIAESGETIRIATDERYIPPVYDGNEEIEQGYTEYDGVDVPREDYEANPSKWLAYWEALHGK